MAWLSGLCRTLFQIFGLLAVFVFYLSTQELPAGTLFQLIGRAQLAIQGSPLTPPVPVDLLPQPRPSGEQFLTLPSGGKMPMSGLGLCCRPTAYHQESVERSVLWFLLQGGRLLDGAHLYLNSAAVGRGIKEAIARGVPRQEIFVVTKIFPSTFGANVTSWVSEQLSVMGLDYFDLVLLHAPEDMFSMKRDNPAALRARVWLALSAAQKQGLIRNLGVSNFCIQHMEEIAALGAAPIAAHQLVYSPWVPRSLRDVVAYCHKAGIAVTGYSGLGGWFSSLWKKNAVLQEEAKLDEIAKKHGRTSAQVLSRWAIQQQVAIIPGTGNPKYMAENLSVFGFTLSDSEMAALNNFTPSQPTLRDPMQC